MTYAIAIVNKKNLVTRTVSFENELVPLNGRIVMTAFINHSSTDHICLPQSSSPKSNHMYQILFQWLWNHPFLHSHEQDGSFPSPKLNINNWSFFQEEVQYSTEVN